MVTKVAIIKNLDNGECSPHVQYQLFHYRHDLQERRTYYGTCEKCSAYAVYHYQQKTGKLIEETGKLLSRRMNHQRVRRVRPGLMLISGKSEITFQRFDGQSR